MGDKPDEDAGLLETAASVTARPELGATLASTPGGAVSDIDALGSTMAPDTVSPADAAKVRVRPPSYATGTQLGRYTIIEQLGAGAMGVVYRAEDRELARQVAIKQLHRPDPQLTERLVREARAMAQVNHPNVVGVYDVGVTDGTTYIAMELIEGRSLRDWQEKRSVNEILEAYIAAGRGLAAAHARGIVHRDFKPDNCLVGRDGRVRVGDFGLAATESRAATGDGKKPSRSIEDINLTTQGSVLGTPAYMAPEQFEGGNVDARTDQFSFCVALHEALYGTRPFAGKTFPELADNVCDGVLQPPPRDTQVSAGLRAIVLRGVSVKPGDRYPTMDHLLDDLGRDRAKPWRRTAQIATAIAVLLAIGLGSDWVLRDRVRERIDLGFATTATQAANAVEMLDMQFEANSKQALVFPAIIEVSAKYDNADFGLGDADTDTQDLVALHAQLQSTTWAELEIRHFGMPIIAVADYKGRMLYSSAAPDVFGTDMLGFPWFRAAFDKRIPQQTISQRFDDPALVATKVLGDTAPDGVAVLFTRTVIVGDSPRTLFLQIIPAKQLLDRVVDRIEGLQVSLISPDGGIVGNVPGHLLSGAPSDDYAVRTIDLGGIGTLVMAQERGGSLSLFPHARLVFVLALLASLLVAAATALRAKQITGARAG